MSVDGSIFLGRGKDRVRIPDKVLLRCPTSVTDSTISDMEIDKVRFLGRVLKDRISPAFRAVVTTLNVFIALAL